MPKTVKQTTAAAPRLPVKLTIYIPPAMVPLFEAMCIVHKAGSRESFAARAVCKWLLSEEAVKAFDDLINSLDA